MDEYSLEASRLQQNELTRVNTAAGPTFLNRFVVPVSTPPQCRPILALQSGFPGLPCPSSLCPLPRYQEEQGSGPKQRYENGLMSTNSSKCSAQTTHLFL